MLNLLNDEFKSATPFKNIFIQQFVELFMGIKPRPLGRIIH